jgi:hypothetical protein
VRNDASDFRWSHNDWIGDIIAYAVTPERAPSPPAKSPTDAVEAVALVLAAQMEAQSDDTTPSSMMRANGLVWLEGWFNLEAALAAARPFTAECAKGEFSAGQAVIYTPFGEEGFHANFEGYVEGWPNLRFKDGSTCIVRPSRVIGTAIKETIR